MAIRLYIINAWFTVPSQLVKGLQHYWPLPFRVCVRSALCCSVQRDRNQAGSDTGTPVSLQMLSHLFI